MSYPKSHIRSRRFSNKKRAFTFAKSVKGEVKDLTMFLTRKSNYRVFYTKGNANQLVYQNIEILDKYYL